MAHLKLPARSQSKEQSIGDAMGYTEEQQQEMVSKMSDFMVEVTQKIDSDELVEMGDLFRYVNENASLELIVHLATFQVQELYREQVREMQRMENPLLSILKKITNPDAQ